MALASAQIHFEDNSLMVDVNQFEYRGRLISVSFGPPLSSLDVFMTEKQFGELVDELKAARERMEAGPVG